MIRIMISGFVFGVFLMAVLVPLAATKISKREIERLNKAIELEEAERMAKHNAEFDKWYATEGRFQR